MDRDTKNNICEDIYSGFMVGKIEPEVLPGLSRRVSEAKAMQVAHRIAKVSREEKMPSPHNGDDMLIWIERIKEIIYEELG